MYICEMLHLMSGQVGRWTGEWVGEQAGGLGPGMGRHASAGRHASVGRWVNVGRWVSGPASECGQVSEWVGERAGKRVWAGERGLAGGPVGRRASMGW